MANVTELSRQDYTVGWICALSVEAAAAEAVLDEKHRKLPQIEQDHNRYILGRIGQHNVVITCLPSGSLGTSNATMVATQMFRTYTKIKFCLMVGVGGGVPSLAHDIRLGDVAVGLGVTQYDAGKTVQGGKFSQTNEVNKPSSFLLTALSALRSRHMIEGIQFPKYLPEVFKKHPPMAPNFAHPGNGYDFLYEPAYDHPEGKADCSQCEEDQCIKRPPRVSQDPAVHYGLIASGNQVMRHGATRERLSKQIGAICFEMEAAGIINVFHACLVVRGICDYSDSHKNKRWQPYAAMTAACYAKEFLSEIEAVEVRKICTVTEEIVQPGECALSSLLPDPFRSPYFMRRNPHAQGVRANARILYSYMSVAFNFKNRSMFMKG